MEVFFSRLFPFSVYEQIISFFILHITWLFSSFGVLFLVFTYSFVLTNVVVTDATFSFQWQVRCCIK